MPPDLPKRRSGLRRILLATGHSLAGLRSAWGETSFRQEAIIALVLLPAAFWLGTSWVEQLLLIATLVLVLVVELLNTALEAVVDRIGLDWHPLSKRAKDVGSAAVLLSLALCAAVWLTAVVVRLAA